ncbi:MAG TPA: carboxypeptidase regulatory-like domain-containing protein [Bryobacteraceae bacterium]|nr:carboxypeptidase regulatory-like domain-containing protein [Bryobacteraceae bacterium]
MFTILCLFFQLHEGLPGQSTKTEWLGEVRDARGLPVEGASLELRNSGTAAKARAVTDSQGSYHFFALAAGTYSVTVRKEGFAELSRSGILLRVGDRIVWDVQLEVGNESQAVEVTAQAPLLQSSRGTVSFVVEQKRMAALPLDGRNFIPLIALAPGVSLPPGSTLPRINGSRPRVSEYLYDGISVLQPEPGQVAFFPVIDAIEEFRLEVNSYSAEYGRSNGGVIMVNQKSGSNEYHGTLFEFLGNDLDQYGALAGAKSGTLRKAIRHRISSTRGWTITFGHAIGSSPVTLICATTPRPRSRCRMEAATSLPA